MTFHSISFLHQKIFIGFVFYRRIFVHMRDRQCIIFVKCILGIYIGHTIFQCVQCVLCLCLQCLCALGVGYVGRENTQNGVSLC